MYKYVCVMCKCMCSQYDALGFVNSLNPNKSLFSVISAKSYFFVL